MSKNKNFDSPLNQIETEYQTLGCRCYNPDICKNCYSEKCAFIREDNICKIPPKTWKKRMIKLKN